MLSAGRELNPRLTILCDLPVSFSGTAFITNIVRYVKYSAAYSHSACEHARKFTYKLAVNTVRFFLLDLELVKKILSNFTTHTVT
jgi:hypothetical protein